MNVLRRLLLGTGLLFWALGVLAQAKTVTGVITGSDGTPLSGVTVRVKGTSRTVQTNSSGQYTISAAPGETLQVSYVGYGSRELTVGEGSQVNARLTETDNTLETVVVAMDIKRNPKELGYSVARVTGAEIQETQRENFVNSLQGRVAGLTINPTGGTAGASSQIVLRGFNSLSLTNEPLFVIDGVIIDNQTLSENHGGGGPGTSIGLASQRENRGNDYTNRISDINPNDIESITVLKGPEATALYGSQAASGAIIITTKKANTGGKVNVAYDNSFRYQQLTRFPEVQSIYGSGRNGISSTNTVADFFSYFGPEIPQGTPRFDNINNFFRTGFAQTHNLALEYGKKNYTMRASGSLFNQKGTIPNNTFNRYNARLSGTAKITKWLEVIPSATFVRSDNRKPLRGLGSYMLGLLQWSPTDDVRNYENETGDKRTLFLANANAEFDNPLFNTENNVSEDKTDRFIGTLGVNINPLAWLSIAGRFGYDTYQSEGYSVFHPTSNYVTPQSGGSLDNYFRRYNGYNHTVTATARKKWNNFSGRVMVGNMWQDYETQMYSVTGTNLVDSTSPLTGRMWKNGSVITNNQFQDILNGGWDSSVTRSATRIRLNNAIRGLGYNKSINRQVAYFGEASIGFKDAIFLTYTHRFEESSIFPAQFRDYNYPAGSISIVPTDLFPGLKTSTFSFWKLRGSLANTARSSAPYANQSIFNANFGSGGGFFYGFTNANPLLQPERQSTYEVGTEVRLWNGRFNIDATYYDTRNKNLIVELFRASYGTGFVLNTLNVGANRNKGLEVALDATPVQTKDFRWNSRINFNRMRNEVTELPTNVPEFYISDTWLYANARGGLVRGGPTTAITAFGYARNNAGAILIDPTNGFPIRDDNFRVRGDRNPDFTVGFLNNLSYKTLSLSFLWDLKMGGDIFNGTDMYLTRTGLSKRTLDRYQSRIVTGVLRDGFENTLTPTPNNIAFVPAFNQGYYEFQLPEEEFIEKDVNWLRLRDITLNYRFPASVIGNSRVIKGLSAFVTGNDLVLITNYTGADPSVNGNTAGTRGVGAFGFDFGNVGTPISVNLGIRANF